MADSPKGKRLSNLKLCAYVTFGLGVGLIVISFATPNWLSSDERLYGHKFVKLGLWEQCFRSMTNPGESFEGTYFVGCRWLFTPWTKDYDRFRDNFILQPFFIAVQVLFTFTLIFVLIGCGLVILYSLCCAPENYKLLLAIAADLLIAAVFGTMSVIIFGARGDGRDWMPDPDHNFLSWSFGLAVVGVYFLWTASLLFYIESRRMRKQEKKEEYPIYPMAAQHSKV